MRLVATLSETSFERGSVHAIAIDAYHVAHNYGSFSTRYLLGIGVQFLAVSYH